MDFDVNKLSITEIYDTLNKINSTFSKLSIQDKDLLEFKKKLDNIVDNTVKANDSNDKNYKVHNKEHEIINHKPTSNSKSTFDSKPKIFESLNKSINEHQKFNQTPTQKLEYNDDIKKTKTGGITIFYM